MMVCMTMQKWSTFKKNPFNGIPETELLIYDVPKLSEEQAGSLDMWRPRELPTFILYTGWGSQGCSNSIFAVVNDCKAFAHDTKFKIWLAPFTSVHYP
jgi:hypothetical protein